eukprot:CAMPEP_0185028758 /NCGR_PEP_ID=MMETSP1103-20130426/14720_1 /TAXON_ID=36769 /ORGANISM="Paraphysomonas bandaiensis, Strain Caron Lab Isolate" /LENGTH=314 /DNA_ID=CAMNT_0027563273 /DNA_START=12 /DNA_END=956 /DNA_ORIENTATION=-
MAKEGDTLMAEGKHIEAKQAHDGAWDLLSRLLTQYEEADGFGKEIAEYMSSSDLCWQLLNSFLAQIKSKNYQSGFQIGKLLIDLFSKRKGFVIGNPMFHLFVGVTKFESDPIKAATARGPGSPHDDFARALIMGGISIFGNEGDEEYKFLSYVVNDLHPPEGFSSWEDTRGTDYGKEMSPFLKTSTGYIREYFLIKRGIICAEDVYEEEIEAMNEEDLADFPAAVEHPSHCHALKKQKCGYDETQYQCDVCGEPGAGWLYACEECSFDAHVSCVFGEDCDDGDDDGDDDDDGGNKARDGSLGNDKQISNQCPQS